MFFINTRAYVHIPKDERSKLNDKANDCIFLGYEYEEFEYRLQDPVIRQLIRSKDVVFFEDRIVSDAQKSDESQSSPKISIIPTLVFPPVVHNYRGGATEDNNDGPAKLVD